MGPTSRMATVVSAGTDGWFIEDAAVVYNTEWTPRPTGSDDDLVSTGFAMDNNMEQLKHSVTHEQYTEAAPSAEEAGSAGAGTMSESARSDSPGPGA